ncbi:MAG: 50S ribosomal protein L4 [Methanonatronarchaeales archaeon]|nr:50S ribosomal protein L4 [Methanonatronarchaeales archaeon]
MRARLIDVEGNDAGEIELPEIFETDVRNDLIRRAVESHRANSREPYGSDRRAGFRTSAESWGAGRGAAMVPRIKNGRRGALVPQTVGGRRAHPPKADKDFSKKINRKERRLAIRCAVAATARPDLVRARGHAAEGPVVAPDELQSVDRTAEVREFLKGADLWSDVERAKRGTGERSGKGKLRGRRRRVPKSILLVVGEDEGIGRGACNLPGVEVCEARSVGVDRLAPGGEPGRLTVYTESALEEFR